MDEFEEQLRRLALQPPPTAWRSEILERARQGRTGFQPVPASVSERPLTTTSDLRQLSTSPTAEELSTPTGHASVEGSASCANEAFGKPAPVTERTEAVTAVQSRTAISEGAHAPTEEGESSSAREPVLHALLTPAADRRDACPTLLAALRSWLWPHPGAWTALAAVWLLLFAVRRDMEVEIEQELALAGIEPPTKDVMVAFEERQLLVAQLLASGDFQLPAADRPRPALPSRPNSPPLMLITS